MTAPVLTFFNNKGGVGKTSLVYHLAWMFAELGKKVAVADLDPQANLTAAFLPDDDIEALWEGAGRGSTIFECVKPLTGVGDIIESNPIAIAPNLVFLPGDIKLSRFEEELSAEWPRASGYKNLYRRLKVLTAFWSIIQMVAKKADADLILVDIGPNLGAINHSVMLATDWVAIPLGADLFSLRGLANLGPTLVAWREEWQTILKNWTTKDESKEYPDFQLPSGHMKPIGYLCQQHSVRLERPVLAYDRWVQRIPSVYREQVLGGARAIGMKQQDDPYCLATIRHYRSLIPMGQEHRKPIFRLTPADGAIGSHAQAVARAKEDFRALAQRIAKEIGLSN